MGIIKNSIYNVLYQILTIITPIITVPYVSRVLGASGVGKQAYTNAIVQYFILIGVVGLNIYGNRQIAYVRDNQKKLRNTFWQLCYIRFITITTSLVLFLIFFVVINKNDRFIYAIQSLNIVAVLFDISWYYMGLENFKKTVIRNSITKILGVALIFIFVRNHNDVWIYILILSSTQLLGQVVMWINVPKFINPKVLNKNEVMVHFKYAIKLFIPQLAAQVYLLLDKIMLGCFYNDEVVGIYENSQRIIRLVMPIVTAIGTTMIPRMSNLYIKGEVNEFKNNIYRVFSLMNFLAIPIAFGVMGIAKGFSPWFFGSEFKGVSILIMISSFVIIFGTWCNILGFQVLIPMKREKEFTISVVIGSIVNFILNLVLIKNFAAIGTSIASVIAELIVPIIQLYFLRNLINYKELFKGVLKYILVSIIMTFTIYIFNGIFPSSILLTCFQIVLGAIVYISIMIIVKDRNIYMIKEIITRFKR